AAALCRGRPDSCRTARGTRRWLRAPLSDPEDGVEIDRGGEVAAEIVERALDRRLVGEVARRRAEVLEESGAEAIRREQPVERAAGDPAVGADRAVEMACPIRADNFQHRPRAVRTVGAPEMDLVAGDGLACGELAAVAQSQGLRWREHGLNVEQAEPR